MSTRQFAVVTGASSGIGEKLAHEFASHGFDLIVNAEDARVHEVATALRAHGTTVIPVQQDLSDADGVEKLYAAIVDVDRPVDAIALNAGVGRGGASFVETDLGDDLKVIDLNVTSTVHLAKRVLKDMVRRGEGKVLITSSIASTMPGAYLAVYNASKSFLQSFTQALQAELKGTRVTITSLMPGPTETNFFRRAKMGDTLVGRMKKDDPAQVAKDGFEAMMAGERRVVAGSRSTRAQELVNKVLPDAVKAATHRFIARPRPSR